MISYSLLRTDEPKQAEKVKTVNLTLTYDNC